jgi:hypothetical protein
VLKSVLAPQSVEIGNVVVSRLHNVYSLYSNAGGLQLSSGEGRVAQVLFQALIFY